MSVTTLRSVALKGLDGCAYSHRGGCSLTRSVDTSTTTFGILPSCTRISGRCLLTMSAASGSSQWSHRCLPVVFRTCRRAKAPVMADQDSVLFVSVHGNGVVVGIGKPCACSRPRGMTSPQQHRTNGRVDVVVKEKTAPTRRQAACGPRQCRQG